MKNQKVLRLFANPKNVGIIQGASGIGNYTNEKTSDVMKLYLKVEDEEIIDAKFKTYSNYFGIAILSDLTELIKGKYIEEAEELDEEQLLDSIGIIDEDRKYLITDALNTLQLAIKDYKKKLVKQQKLAW